MLHNHACVRGSGGDSRGASRQRSGGMVYVRRWRVNFVTGTSCSAPASARVFSGASGRGSGRWCARR